MRLTLAKLMTVAVVVLNFIAVYFIWKLVTTRGKSNTNKLKLHSYPLSVEHNNLNYGLRTNQDVTFVLRSFEDYEHDIVETVISIQTVFSNATILVISDSSVYPPILINSTIAGSSSVRFINLKTTISQSFKDRNPILQIKTKYVLFIPDATRFDSKDIVNNVLRMSETEEGTIIAIPVNGFEQVQCLKTHIDIREWTLRFDKFPDSKDCNYITGKHALFIELENLLKVSDPFMLPFPDSLYLQCAFHKIKVKVADKLSLSNGRELFRSRHQRWKVQQALLERQRAMFQRLELKKVVRENGVAEWYGCSRDTPRCFGTIVDETPQYLWEGKWTPPCCLAGLRRTARHVFTQLEEARVRYWLEGGSLLGAMRAGDILPWDYDVDVGIYREDIPRCTWLLRAADKPITDTHGFLWERAVEGEFFRVQFSATNHLHVDIFPFHSRNGTMTKDTWFKNHRQDMEFPEHYLKPLSTIDFVGMTVSAPNNIHDFLELKFGEGAIETPEYPNPYKMALHGQPRGPSS